MESHTPGPWVAVGDYRAAFICGGPRRQTTICEIWGWRDALLVAAAPELLASLEELLRVIEPRRIPGVKRITNRARKVIAKATGETI